MIYQFWPQFLILICLIGIIVIVFRRLQRIPKIKPEKKMSVTLPKLSPSVKIARPKNRIIIWIQKLKDKIFHISLQAVEKALLKIRHVRKAKPATEVAVKELHHLAIVQPTPALIEKKQKLREKKKKYIKNQIFSLFNKAELLQRSDKLLEAEKVYIEIVKLDPKNIDAYKKLGAIYLKLKNFGDAKASFRQVIKLKPDDKDALLQLKNLDEMTEKIEETK